MCFGIIEFDFCSSKMGRNGQISRHMFVSIYNNPSVNLATGVAYVDGRAAGAGAGGGRGRTSTTCADWLRAKGEGGVGVARRVAYSGRYTRLWLVILIITVMSVK